MVTNTGEEVRFYLEVFCHSGHEACPNFSVFCMEGEPTAAKWQAEVCAGQLEPPHTPQPFSPCF